MILMAEIGGNKKNISKEVTTDDTVLDFFLKNKSKSFTIEDLTDNHNFSSNIRKVLNRLVSSGFITKGSIQSGARWVHSYKSVVKASETQKLDYESLNNLFDINLQEKEITLKPINDGLIPTSLNSQQLYNWAMETWAQPTFMSFAIPFKGSGFINYQPVIKIVNGYKIKIPDVPNFIISGTILTERQFETPFEKSDNTYIQVVPYARHVDTKSLQNSIDPHIQKFFPSGDSSVEDLIAEEFNRVAKLGGYLNIIDPYLSMDYIDFLEKIPPSTQIKILTKQFATNNRYGASSTVEDLITALNALPQAEIEIKQQIQVGKSPNLNKLKGNGPFHDRSILGNNRGLHIGTSLNSIIRNETNVTVFTGGKELLQHFDDWFSGQVQTSDGKEFHCVTVFKKKDKMVKNMKITNNPIQVIDEFINANKFQEALDVISEIEENSQIDTSLKSVLINRKSHCLISTGRLNEGESFIMQHLQFAKDNDLELRAILELNRGIIAMKVGNYNKAKEQLDVAKTLFASTNNDYYIGSILLHQWDLNFRQGRFLEAKNNAIEGLRCFVRINFEQQFIIHLTVIKKTFAELHDKAGFVNFAKNFRDSVKKQVSLLTLRNIEDLIRKSAEDIRDYETCSKATETIIEIIKKTGSQDKSDLGKYYNKLGQYFDRRGQLDLALEAYSKVITLGKETNDENRAIALANIGGVLNQKGKYEEAFDNLEKARKLNEIVANKELQGHILNGIGIYKLHIGLLDEARERYEECLNIVDELNMLEEKAVILNNIAIIKQRNGQYASAIEDLHQAEKINQDNNADYYNEGVYNNLGALYKDIGDLNLAKHYLLKSLGLKEKFLNNERTGFGIFNLLLVDIIATNTYKEELLQKLEQMAKETGNINLQLRVDFIRGFLLVKNRSIKKKLDAKPHFEKIIGSDNVDALLALLSEIHLLELNIMEKRAERMISIEDDVIIDLGDKLDRFIENLTTSQEIPRLIDMYVLKAEFVYMIGQPDEAIQNLERAIEFTEQISQDHLLKSLKTKKQQIQGVATRIEHIKVDKLTKLVQEINKKTELHTITVERIDQRTKRIEDTGDENKAIALQNQEFLESLDEKSILSILDANGIAEFTTKIEEVRESLHFVEETLFDIDDKLLKIEDITQDANLIDMIKSFFNEYDKKKKDSLLKKIFSRLKENTVDNLISPSSVWLLLLLLY